jgi:hypothetical protein
MSMGTRLSTACQARGAAPKRRPSRVQTETDAQPVKRGAALRRGFPALQTLNVLRVVVT